MKWPVTTGALILSLCSCTASAAAQTRPATTINSDEHSEMEHGALLAPLHGAEAAGAIIATTDPAHPVMETQTEAAQRVEVPSVLRGLLVRVAVHEGEPIKKGATIAQLDDTIQKDTVELAKLQADSTIEIRAAEAQVEYAENELERYQKIAQEAGNMAELRQRQLTLKQAQLALEQKKEQQKIKQIDLAREEATLARMTITSPLDGEVLRINHEAGELVDDTKPLAVIVETRQLNARFFAPKELFGKVHVGDQITVTLKTQPSQKRTAEVIAVDPILDPAAGMFMVKVRLDNADQSIPAGIAAVWKF